MAIYLRLIFKFMFIPFFFTEVSYHVRQFCVIFDLFFEKFFNFSENFVATTKSKSNSNKYQKHLFWIDRKWTALHRTRCIMCIAVLVPTNLIRFGTTISLLCLSSIKYLHCFLVRDTVHRSKGRTSEPHVSRSKKQSCFIFRVVWSTHEPSHGCKDIHHSSARTTGSVFIWHRFGV